MRAKLRKEGVEPKWVKSSIDNVAPSRARPYTDRLLPIWQNACTDGKDAKFTKSSTEGLSPSCAKP